MILDGIHASEVSDDASITEKAVSAFIQFAEKKLDFTAIRNTHGIPRELVRPLQIAARLRKEGIIDSFGKGANYPDAPHMYSWSALGKHIAGKQAGGATFEDNASALYATVCEAQERYLWTTQRDHFVDPREGTFEEIQSFGPAIAPERFAGYSEAERARNPVRQLRKDSKFLWVRAKSLVSGGNVYVPAQSVSGGRFTHSSVKPASDEPHLRQRTTIGLATWKTLTGARLRGALEVIERDAYMIQWFSQLTLPRIPLAYLQNTDPVLAQALEACERYRMKPHVVSLLTDAPAHAVMVVIEDITDAGPRFSIGLNAHRELCKAVHKGLTEALRTHRGWRRRKEAGVAIDPSVAVPDIGHRERVDYWALPDNAKRLEFLIAGEEMQPEKKPWDTDTEEEHLGRISEWCRSRGYECATVSLGACSKNFTGFNIEVVTIPELQPAYLEERYFTSGGKRWREIPEMFGRRPRKTPFSERPHPFS
jgi:thiazole/oxazole-forming peptide maturase SagD family component